MSTKLKLSVVASVAAALSLTAGLLSMSAVGASTASSTAKDGPYPSHSQDSGFCGKGEGMEFVRDHDLSYKGDFPCNTHGGQLGFGQAGLAGGMSHVVEAVRQIQGRADDRQLIDHDVAYVSGTGGIMSEQAALVLRGT